MPWAVVACCCKMFIDQEVTTSQAWLACAVWAHLTTFWKLTGSYIHLCLNPRLSPLHLHRQGSTVTSSCPETSGMRVALALAPAPAPESAET